jgi:hypothetical protein
MLDRKMLEDMPPGTIFADGVEDDYRWIAIRGGIADWAIYYDEVDDINLIRDLGIRYGISKRKEITELQEHCKNIDEDSNEK